MYYCMECQIKKQWPCSLAKSFGTCEVCGKKDLCNDMKSAKLSKPEIMNAPTEKEFFGSENTVAHREREDII
ncbi:hypothetical protein LCGC14_1247200 [marine sediment metagenome]|uniref:Uncharacterized protein n=1 Tax=marine sediment metagenome TaxID=412755 RepID=A0A0F9L459_9ZZZZ